MDINEKLLNMLNNSFDTYFAINECKKLLDENGYIRLYENEKYDISAGKSYYILRNDSALIAFKVPKNLTNLYFKIVSTHADSPVLKIKQNPTVIQNGYNKLKVETYGGMINSCWLDKPLKIAGKVSYFSNNSIKSQLVNFDVKVIIPNLAIHQNREINDGYKYNPQIDLLPILGIGEEDLFEKMLNNLRQEGEKNLNYDLSLYNDEKSIFGGFNNELIYSRKEDDLASAFISIMSLIESNDIEGISLSAIFNNEEVGSSSLNGADSDFLDINLRRIANSLGFLETDLYEAYAKSFIISCDNAHAIHPNHPEKSDDKNIIKINKGIVIKFNSNMHYTTDCSSSSIISLIALNNNLKYQYFYNRSDERGGSTLGNISLNHVSIRTVDIGLPQLAMHSNYEVMGSKDTLDLFKLLNSFYSSNLKISDKEVKIN